MQKNHEFPIYFTELQRKFYLNLHNIGTNSYTYVFANSAVIYKFQAKDSGTNSVPSYLVNA